MTPGSGVTLITFSRGSDGGSIAFDQERQVELDGGGFDGSEKFEIILQLLDRRHEHTEPAVARLD